MRVLLVEDEVALREDLKTELGRSGFSVDLAADGQEGLLAGLNYPRLAIARLIAHFPG